jgi:hypothetical protein
VTCDSCSVIRGRIHGDGFTPMVARGAPHAGLELRSIFAMLLRIAILFG